MDWRKIGSSLVAIGLTTACTGEDGVGTGSGGSGASSAGGTTASQGGNALSGGAGATGGDLGTGGSGASGAMGGSSPGNPLFFDDFEYEVPATADPQNLARFQSAGWATAKAINVTGSHGGNLYTAESIEGYAGSFPGVASNRVLCINSLAGTLGLQTDFYLQLGDGVTTDALPGDVWIQFWIYPNRVGAEQTGFHSREKFLYPCDGPYPCSTNKWLWMLSSSSYEPQNLATSDGNAFIVSRDNTVGTVDYALAAPENVSKIGQTDTSEWIAPNRWTLVKIHYDTSTTIGRYEAWLRPLGGGFTQVASWLGGVTPDFTWDIPPEQVGGHRMLRMPTTMPANATNGSEDAWLYLDDFAIAESEADLPSY
ncbi:MAG: hypothetical protein KC731_01435 [Myxococcales bacterium]|nr:hypothetical protein [Myxococcales bacterium]